MWMDPETEQAIADANKSQLGFVTKDSGKKAVYEDGMQRDTTEGKPMFGLMFPEGVPYEEQLITRVADLYARGAVKYGDRNWEKSCTPKSLNHHREAFWRHAVKFFLGVQDGEDHAAAVVWNVNAVELTRRNIRLREADAAAVADDDLDEELPAQKTPAVTAIGFQPPGRMIRDDLVLAPDNTVWVCDFATNRWFLSSATPEMVEVFARVRDRHTCTQGACNDHAFDPEAALKAAQEQPIFQHHKNRMRDVVSEGKTDPSLYNDEVR